MSDQQNEAAKGSESAVERLVSNFRTKLFVKTEYIDGVPVYWVKRRWLFIAWKVSDAGPFRLKNPWLNKGYAIEKIKILEVDC